MKITDIVEARKPNHLRASDKKPKLIKPNLGHESPNVNRGKLVGEADQPADDKSARFKVNHSLRAQGHKVVPDKKKELKKGKVKHKGKIQEGPLVVSGDHNLLKMIDTFVDSWKRKDHTDDEYAELLKVLGYKLEKDGKRSVITIDEGNGNIRKGLGAAALIAALGLSMPSAKDTPLGKELAQAASAGDPVAAYHLDKMDLYVEADDQRTLVNLKIRYLEDSDREDVHDYLAKKAGIDENYMTEEQFEEAAGEKDACYHKVKSRYKVWPSAYASGALVQCRKKGAKNWGNSKKK
jgi:hypothetical protein